MPVWLNVPFDTNVWSKFIIEVRRSVRYCQRLSWLVRVARGTALYFTLLKLSSNTSCSVAVPISFWRSKIAASASSWVWLPQERTLFKLLPAGMPVSAKAIMRCMYGAVEDADARGGVLLTKVVFEPVLFCPITKQTVSASMVLTKISSQQSSNLSFKRSGIWEGFTWYTVCGNSKYPNAGALLHPFYFSPHCPLTPIF